MRCDYKPIIREGPAKILLNYFPIFYLKDSLFKGSTPLLAWIPFILSPLLSYLF